MAKEKVRSPHLDGHPIDDSARINQETKEKLWQIFQAGRCKRVDIDKDFAKEALIFSSREIAPGYEEGELYELFLDLKEELERARGAEITWKELGTIVSSYTSAHDSNPLGHTSEGDSDNMEDHAEKPSLRDSLYFFAVGSDPELYPHGFTNTTPPEEVEKG